MSKKLVIVALTCSLGICVIFGFGVFLSEIKIETSNSLIVRIAPGSSTRNLTGQDYIGINHINGFPVSQFHELQELLGKVEKSKSINIDYFLLQEPKKIISIATPSLDPTSFNDYYSAFDLGILPSESVIFCLRKKSTLSELKLKVNDVIILINNKPINDLIKNGATSLSGAKKIQISVLRNGQIINLENEFPFAIRLESLTDLGYLYPSPSFILSTMPWHSFDTNSIFMNMKGFSCANNQ